MSEAELRCEALRQAVAHEQNRMAHGLNSGPEDVVRTAQAFTTFLTGSGTRAHSSPPVGT